MVDTDLLVRLWSRAHGAAADDGDAPGHARFMGIELVAAGRAGLELRWQPGAALASPIGLVHGGYTAAVLDDAAGLACATFQDDFRPMVTLDLRIDYLRGVAPGGTYRARGAVVHPGRQRMLAQATLHAPDGRLAAHAVGSFLPHVPPAP